MVINLAVVGLGKMGLSHLAIVNALAEFRVVAICDSAMLVGSVIEKYSGLRFIPKFSDVLELPDLEAVIIATPTVSHESMVRAALERGLHVFCEKPLTLSAAESRGLAALAQAKGLVSQVGYHNRFIGTFSELSTLMGLGALGRITHLQAEAYGPVVLRPTKPTWRGKAGQGGGCLLDYAAHPINLLNWYLGTPQSCSSAVLKSGYSAEVDDEVYATIAFPNGVTSQLSVNWSDASVRKMTTRISAWGDGGKIYADRQEIQVFLTGNAPIPPGYRPGWTVRYITDLSPPVSFYLRGEEYTAQVEAFGRAILANARSNQNDFVSASETDQTIELIRSVAAQDGSVQTSAQPRVAKRGLVGRVLGR